MQGSARLIQRRFKRYIKRKGLMEEYRILDLIKHSHVVIFSMMQDREEENAKKLVTGFLKEYVKKVNIKNKIIQYTQKSKSF